MSGPRGHGGGSQASQRGTHSPCVPGKVRSGVGSLACLTDSVFVRVLPGSRREVPRAPTGMATPGAHLAGQAFSGWFHEGVSGWD